MIAATTSLYGGQPVSTLRQYIDQMKWQKVACLQTQIRENKTLFGSAGDAGIPVVLQQVGNQKTYEEVVKELHTLAQEVLQEIEHE